MKRSLLLFLVSTLIISCVENKSGEKFSLSGTINGIENGTKLLLINNFTQKVIDSTIVHDNKFQIEGILEKSPTQAAIHTIDYSEFRIFWLENSDIDFNASNSNFRDAKISGSETEMLAQALSEQTDTIKSREGKQKIEMEFIKSHPNSILSAYTLALNTMTGVWGKEKASELFLDFSKETKESEYGKYVSNYIKLYNNLRIGEDYIDFAMEDQNGLSKKLSDLKGKTVLLEFWASWCGPCRAGNPDLINTYNQFHHKGFEIFAVSLDNDKDNWVKAIEEDGLPWIHVCDLQGSNNIARFIYGVNGIPDNFLIDENGIIIARGLRGDELNKKLYEIISATKE